jgi:hypothetical protein
MTCFLVSLLSLNPLLVRLRTEGTGMDMHTGMVATVSATRMQRRMQVMMITLRADLDLRRMEKKLVVFFAYVSSL